MKLHNINKLGGKVLENRALPPFVFGTAMSIAMQKVSRINAKV